MHNQISNFEEQSRKPQKLNRETQLKSDKVEAPIHYKDSLEKSEFIDKDTYSIKMQSDRRSMSADELRLGLKIRTYLIFKFLQKN